MSAVQKRTVSLPLDQSGYIDTLVSRGSYASASEVVRAGLRALQEREAAIKRWLEKEVAPTVDRMRADPSRAISADDVSQILRAHHAKRGQLRD